MLKKKVQKGEILYTNSRCPPYFKILTRYDENLSRQHKKDTSIEDDALRLPFVSKTLNWVKICSVALPWRLHGEQCWRTFLAFIPPFGLVCSTCGFSDQRFMARHFECARASARSFIFIVLFALSERCPFHPFIFISLHILLIYFLLNFYLFLYSTISHYFGSTGAQFGEKVVRMEGC